MNFNFSEVPYYEKDKPKCPRCHTNANVVKYTSWFRCCFCGSKFFEKREGGQQILNL